VPIWAAGAHFGGRVADLMCREVEVRNADAK